MDVIQSVTFGVALVGAVLGILNTWRAFDRDRVSLLVAPNIVHAIIDGKFGPPLLSINIVNLSFFAVTIAEVGFLLRGTKERWVIAPPIMMDGGKFPRRLEPRSSFSVLAESGTHLRPDFVKVTHAFAVTECRRTFKGKGPAFKALMDIG
ncbi:MAG: hypothetical protein HQL90_07430 [Magnetococcales bacterium]|nr:hypothetical protein [Magnetococcales bacterium]